MRRPALPVRTERLWAALLAATLMNLPLGSVYSFSVLLRPIEQELAIPRSALSLVFGLCTVGFTVGSVGAAFLYRVAPAPILVLASALVAAGGIVHGGDGDRAHAVAARLRHRVRHRRRRRPTSCCSRA